MIINVVISNYNTADRLRQTLSSIRVQSISSYRVYLVDACSTDGVEDVIHEFQNILYCTIREDDNGLYDGLSKVFRRLAHLDGICCYINAGDIYMPYAFQSIINAFTNNPSVNWLTGIPATRDSRYRLISSAPPLPYLQCLSKHGMYNTPLLPAIQQESCFWRCSLLALVDLDILSQCKYAGDGYLWCSFSKQHSLYILNVIVSSFTLHGNHLSGSEQSYQRELRTLSPTPNLLINLFALSYGLVGRFLRIPQRIYKELPTVISD